MLCRPDNGSVLLLTLYIMIEKIQTDIQHRDHAGGAQPIILNQNVLVEVIEGRRELRGKGRR